MIFAKTIVESEDWAIKVGSIVMHRDGCHGLGKVTEKKMGRLDRSIKVTNWAFVEWFDRTASYYTIDNLELATHEDIKAAALKTLSR